MTTLVPRAIMIAMSALVLGALLGGCSARSPQPDASRPATTSGPEGAAERAPGCESQTASTPGRTVPESISSGGRARQYLLHIPAGYDPRVAMPLILAFHARGSSGAELEKYSQLSTDDHAIVAYPQGLPSGGEPSWESAPYAPGADDVAFVRDLVTHLQSTLCIDGARVYAVGKSNGGGFVGLLACELPDRIAAFAIVSGAFYLPDADRCASTLPVPVVEFHGTADPEIHYQGGSSHGATYMPVESWLAYRARLDGCSSAPDTTTVAPSVTRLDWTGCDGRGAVTHYRIAGGGHTWPGAPSPSGPGATTDAISATSLILAFFDQHAMPVRP